MKSSDVFWALVVGVGAYLLWEWWQGNAAPAARQTTPSAPIPLTQTTPSAPIQVVVPVTYPGPGGPGCIGPPWYTQAGCAQINGVFATPPSSCGAPSGYGSCVLPTSAPIFPSGGGPSQVVAVTTPTLPVQSFNVFGGVPVPTMYPGGNPSGPIMGGVVNLGSQS